MNKNKCIKTCPTCKSEDLEHEYQSLPYIDPMSRRIGGGHTSSPRHLEGCSCNSCGSIFKFRKCGKCPICDGTGQMKFQHYTALQLTSTTSEKCWECGGSGEIT